jgi:hypothetical protein
MSSRHPPPPPPPHNYNFLKPKHRMELDKYSFKYGFGEDINNLVIYSAIFKRKNVLMNQLSQIVSTQLNMFHLTSGKRISSNLYNTLFIIVDCSRVLNRKSKFTQKLVDLYRFSAYLNDTMILRFCSR